MRLSPRETHSSPGTNSSSNFAVRFVLNVFDFALWQRPGVLGGIAVHVVMSVCICEIQKFPSMLLPKQCVERLVYILAASLECAQDSFLLVCPCLLLSHPWLEQRIVPSCTVCLIPLDFCPFNCIPQNIRRQSKVYLKQKTSLTLENKTGGFFFLWWKHALCFWHF